MLSDPYDSEIRTYCDFLSDDEFINQQMWQYWDQATKHIEKNVKMFNGCSRCVALWSMKFAEEYFEEEPWAIELFNKLDLERLHMLALIEEKEIFEEELRQNFEKEMDYD